MYLFILPTQEMLKSLLIPLFLVLHLMSEIMLALQLMLGISTG